MEYWIQQTLVNDDDSGDANHVPNHTNYSTCMESFCVISTQTLKPAQLESNFPIPKVCVLYHPYEHVSITERCI